MHMLRMTSSMTSAMQTQLRNSNDEQQRLWRALSVAQAELDSAKNEEHQRFAALMLAEKADARKDEVLKYTLPMLPVVASRFLADGGAGGQNTALLFMMQRFAGSLTSEQKMEIFSKLSNEQKLLFVELNRLASESGGGGAGSGPASSRPPSSPQAPSAPTPPPRP